MARMNKSMGIVLRGILALAIVILPFQVGADMVLDMDMPMSGHVVQALSSQPQSPESPDTHCDACCGSECSVTHCVASYCGITGVAILTQNQDFSLVSARFLAQMADVLIFSSYPVSIFRPPRS